MKRILSTALTGFLAMSLAFLLTAAAAPAPKIISADINFGGSPAKLSFSADVDKGVFSFLVECKEHSESETRDACVIVTKDTEVYRYFMKRNELIKIPMNMGSGVYQIIVGFMHKPGYAIVVWKSDFPIDLKNTFAPFLSSSQLVNWNDKMELFKTAKSLVSKLSQKETVESVIKYIQSNFIYYNPDVQPGYIPDLDAVFKSKRGICFDFAALCCAMLRSQGIPAKLLMGYSEYIGEGYHAWCQVYADGKWMTVDPTYINKKGLIFLDETKMKIQKTY